MVSTSTKSAPVKPGAAGLHILSERRRCPADMGVRQLAKQLRSPLPVEYPEGFNLMHTIQCIFFSGVLLGCAELALPSPVIYNVTVNTTSIAGTPGSVDFNFNPGSLVTQAASLQILNFSADGSLAGNPVSSGDVSGALPATLTFDNGTAFNDYFEGFTFDSKLSFDVSLYGSALNSPDGTSTSGSTFAFSMFSDAAGTTPVLTNDSANGFAFVVNVNLDGTTAATDFITASSVPEPSCSLLVGVAVAFGILRLRRRGCVSPPV